MENRWEGLGDEEGQVENDEEKATEGRE